MALASDEKGGDGKKKKKKGKGKWASRNGENKGKFK